MTNDNTLEDIIKASKSKRKVDELAEAFQKNPYENIIPELVEIDKSLEAFEEMGIDLEQTVELSPTQTNDILQRLQSRYQGAIIKNTAENYDGVLNSVAASEKGLQRIVGLLSGIKPVEVGGNMNAKDKLYSAHEKAYKISKDAESNPDAVFAKVMDKYKDTVGGQAIMFLVQKHPDLIKHIAAYQQVRAIKALEKEIKDSGVGTGAQYLKNSYANADDKTRKTIAYNLGQSFASSQSEKPKLRIAKRESPQYKKAG